MLYASAAGLVFSVGTAGSVAFLRSLKGVALIAGWCSIAWSELQRAAAQEGAVMSAWQKLPQTAALFKPQRNPHGGTTHAVALGAAAC